MHAGRTERRVLLVNAGWAAGARGEGEAWMLGQAGMMFLFGTRATLAGAWQRVQGLR